MIGCYLDYSTLVLDDPAGFLFTEGYFLFGYDDRFASLPDLLHQSFITLRPVTQYRAQYRTPPPFSTWHKTS